jgi:hypothetical protein
MARSTLMRLARMARTAATIFCSGLPRSAGLALVEEFPSQSAAALVKRPLGRKPIYYHNNDINTKK